MATATKPVRPEHRWPPIIAIAGAMVLYTTLPDSYSVLPKWVVPVILLLILIPQVILNPHHLTRETRWSRGISIGLALLLFLANQVAVVHAIVELVAGTADAPGVLLATLEVWVTDVIAFGLIYWELDRGGPVARRMRVDPDRVMDFRFPQEDDGATTWHPGFVDYLYFALSNMMAFSPTDVMPMTARAKGIMAVQALTGFVLLALVISRAVNILH